MPPTIINPILNSPYREPGRHFRFDEDGITAEVVEGRRLSTYFVPIPAPKKKGGGPQLSLGMQGDWTAERMKANDFINDIRRYVAAWRQSNYPGITAVTRELLRYWRNDERASPVFFCQFEALETAIFIAEVAGHSQPWIEARLREENEDKNAGLYRIAFKMATGSGKTVVMAMIIAWQALNKLASPQDKRFSDTFLVVTPGITIRDRLRVLQPNDPGNYYVERDLVTPDQLLQLQGASILITNFHAFIARETIAASTTTKKLLAGRDGDPDRFKETPAQVVRRVCRSLGTKKNIVVLNDEAHHCYQSAPVTEKETLTADERAEVNRAREEARIWLNGLRAVKAKLGIRAIYDLSATPFFLKGSGYQEGTLFPWVVSDFALIDAIESGVVKIPRVPVADDTMATDGPVFRELWPRIRDGLPRKGREAEDLGADPKLPAELDDALHQLYANYEKAHTAWKDAGQGTPPVFIVVCQNTSISKLVRDWIAGYERPGSDGGDPIIVPGNLPLFSNVTQGADASQNEWLDRPNTLLIDSAQLESGEAMDPAFKRIASVEIEEFKRQLLAREPHRSEEEVSDEDLLREVMNTVGKRGRLGEQVRCVVSVSMLTEGWDANTVTHILGIRAFGTQLLCEQVVGRGLRRVSYDADEHGMFAPEYAEVYGVPFSFIPTTGSSKPVVQKEVHRVLAQPDRIEYELTFPHVQGYRFDLPTEHLSARFTEDSVMVLSTEEIPTWTEMDPIAGTTEVHRLDLEKRRMQEVAFRIASRTLDGFFRTEGGDQRPWLFPQLLRIATRWLDECVVLKDGTFRQMLLLSEWEHQAAKRVYHAIVADSAGEKRLLPILRPYDQVGSTRYVDFNTTKPVDPAGKSHLNWLVEDSGWEGKVGQVLDELPEIRAWVKNQGLGLRIPYTLDGDAANYLPDLLVRVDDGGPEPLNLLIEVTGERKKDKAAKVEAARTMWVPALNNDGRFGRWAFLEITDPWDAANLIRAHLRDWAGSIA